MSDQAFRPGDVALGAVVIGGVLVVMLPQHAMSIVRLVILTAAVAAALYALGVTAPTAWWRSPFDRTRTRGRVFDEMGKIRSDLHGWRQRVAGAPALPAEVIRQLQELIRMSLAGGEAATLSPLAQSVLRADPKTVPWYRQVPPNGREVAAVVDRVLDELDPDAERDVSPARIETINPGPT